MSLDNSSFAAKHNLALVVARQGRLQESKSLLNDALKQSPNHPLAWYNLAKMYRSNNDLPAARDAYQRALALDQHNVSARNNLAEVLAKLGQSDAAIQQLKLLLKDHPKHPAARQNLLRLLQNRTQPVGSATSDAPAK